MSNIINEGEIITMKKDYIPRKDAQFDEWAQNFSAKIGPIAAALGIAPALISPIINAYAKWDTDFDAHQVAHNAAKSASATKRKSGVTLIRAIRPVVGLIQAYPTLTNAQRKILNITVPDKKPTPASPDYVVALKPPLLVLDWSGRKQVVVHFGVNPSNEKNNAKPPKISGVKIWYRIKGGEWQFVALGTKSPYYHRLKISEPVNLEYRVQWFDRQGRDGVFSHTVKCAVSP